MIYDTPGKVFKGMADSIRQLEGSSSPIPVVDMPDRIRELQRTPLSIDISGKTSRNWIEELIPYVYILRGDSGMSTSLGSMFYHLFPANGSASGHPDIDLSKLYLPPTVQNLKEMFAFSIVNSVDFDNWDTRYITNMESMFAGCEFNKMWLPKTFTNSNLLHPPFQGCGYLGSPFNFDIYTDSTEDRTQEWGINTQYLTVHYNSTHQDFLNA